MAVVYVSEFAEMTAIHNGKMVQAAKQPPIAVDDIAIGGGSTQGNAFNAKTKFIEIHTDAICSIKIGSNPTAVATEGRMAAGETRYYAVNAGDQVAVITNT